MILIPWETGLLLAVGFFVFGFILALAIGVVQVHRWGKEEKENKVSVAESDAEALASARDAADRASDKFLHLFVAMSDEDRIGANGVKIAHLFDRLRRAYVLIEDACAVARGHKIVSPADPETRTYTLLLIDMVEDLGLGKVAVVAKSDFKPEPGPTLH
jgi:hypothetical protein